MKFEGRNDFMRPNVHGTPAWDRVGGGVSPLPFVSFSKEMWRRKQKVPSTCPLPSTTEDL